MSISRKIENDRLMPRAVDCASRALEEFALRMGVTLDDLEDASSESALGDIVDRLVTIGVNAANRADELVS